MKIYESGEDYLETILVLQKELDNVRSIDIVNKLGFSKPSISIAMKKLRELEFIEVSDKGYITLTVKGYDLAQKIYDRHEFITKMFVYLGLDKEQALDNACRMEHILSDDAFLSLKSHFESFFV